MRHFRVACRPLAIQENTLALKSSISIPVKNVKRVVFLVKTVKIYVLWLIFKRLLGVTNVTILLVY